MANDRWGNLQVAPDSLPTWQELLEATAHVDGTEARELLERLEYAGLWLSNRLHSPIPGAEERLCEALELLEDCLEAVELLLGWYGMAFDGVIDHPLLERP